MSPPENGRSAGMKRAEARRESRLASYERRAEGTRRPCEQAVCQRLALPAPSPASRQSEPRHRGAQEKERGGFRHWIREGRSIARSFGGKHQRVECWAQCKQESICTGRSEKGTTATIEEAEDYAIDGSFEETA